MATEITTLEKIVQPTVTPTSGAMGSGTVNTSLPGGGAGKAVLLETDMMVDTVNPIVQFNINNSGVGAAQQTLRIGSIVGQADTYQYYGLTPSAADNAVITDQNGAGCQACQGFSSLVQKKAVLMVSFMVQTETDNDVQLGQNLLYKQLNYDGTVNEAKGNVGWSYAKDQFAKNMRQIYVKYVLDAQYFFEYIIGINKNPIIFLELGASNSVETFKQMPLVAK